MTNLTDADLAAMKARADDADRNRAMYSTASRSRFLTQEASAKDVPALLVEVAALRQQLDLAETCIARFRSWYRQELDLEEPTFEQIEADYDAAKEALDHE